MTTMTTACAYVRVSSRAQDDSTQRAAIARVAASRGDLIGEWYAEKRSAKTTARLDRDEERLRFVRDGTRPVEVDSRTKIRSSDQGKSMRWRIAARRTEA